MHSNRGQSTFPPLRQAAMRYLPRSRSGGVVRETELSWPARGLSAHAGAAAELGFPPSSANLPWRRSDMDGARLPAEHTGAPAEWCPSSTPSAEVKPAVSAKAACEYCCDPVLKCASSQIQVRAVKSREPGRL